MAIILSVSAADHDSDYEERESLSKSELLEIVECLWASRNSKNCDRYEYCMKLLPDGEDDNYRDCLHQVIPEGINCNKLEDTQDMTEAFSQLCITELNKTCISTFGETTISARTTHTDKYFYHVETTTASIETDSE
ncbi:hypothetical protein NPIL_10571 [Nephila pilipes]|uniref:Uncharacterized protein n=1 Tax=Nephila pilipes TaxID=299642 RepID=A0A8X6P4L0_NEPPI|nr:hypothetical protein NPIL_10571 [Nephila pilipes]